MKNWKKNLILGSVLVCVCAGIYLNWQYTAQQVSLEDTLDSGKILNDATLVMSDQALQDAAQEDLATGQEISDYFAAIRLSRQQSRDSALGTLQEAMAYGDESGSSASQEMEALVAMALQEAQIESLVVAKGYEECVAYMTDDGISVAVAAPEEGLTEVDVAVISDIVLSQSDYSLADVRIVEVK